MTCEQLSKLRTIASKKAPELSVEFDYGLVEQSINYLASDKAMESIAIDAYWPKWHSPWWHMLLLHEMGLTSRIPKATVEAVIDSLDTRNLKFFPFTEAEVPPGVDPISQVSCHCQLGTMHQLLTAYGIDIDDRLPWLRPWYLRYQLSDGGLNCDEAAYTKSVPKSSVVSTTASLEALFTGTKETFSPEEIAFLDRGAKYLVEKRLWRTSSTNQPIDEKWLKLSFPRFYHYDVLRGLSFILAWSCHFKRKLPVTAIQEIVEYIDTEFPDGRIGVQRSAWAGANSRYFDHVTGSWTKAPAAGFPLLQAVSEVGRISPFLTNAWSNARANLLAIIDDGLVETTAAE
jgi:hypothetical protein